VESFQVQFLQTGGSNRESDIDQYYQSLVTEY
jgi:hypothetical protein